MSRYLPYLTYIPARNQYFRSGTRGREVECACLRDVYSTCVCLD